MVVRKNIVNGKPRIDGRDNRTVRRSPVIEVGCAGARTARRCSPAVKRRRSWLPRSVPMRDAQMIDALEGERNDRFMLHYNFPPYSVGECGRVGSPAPRNRSRPPGASWRGRRCCRPEETFPYTIRVVSEITESNGSARWRPSAALRWR
jgi:polyribonucleotide nucleotidyltransferase